MNSLLQLRRTPLRSLLGLLLLALAAALLCVTLGQGYAAGRARQTVEDSYHTVALPTDKYKKQQLLDEEGNVLGVTYFEHQPPAVQEFLSTLKDNAPTMVKEDCYHRFASAVIADVTPFNIMSSYIPIPSTGGYGTQLRADPYTGAALVFRLEEIGEAEPYLSEEAPVPLADIATNPQDYGWKLRLCGRVEEVVKLQEGYPSPLGRTLRVTLRFASEEELAALQLREGERYLVYGRDYVDSDFLLRRNLSMGKEAVFEALDSAQVRKLTEEEIFIYNDESWLDTEAMLVARFGDRFLTQAEVDSVDSVALTVCENPLLLVGKLTFDAIDLFDSDAYMTGSLPADEYAARYQQAGILPMEGSGQAFLQTTEDPLWQQAASCIAAENHAFPIVATPALEAVAQFAMQEARITDGRGFRKEEYSDGARVCVISEFLAAKNHLSVGDKLSLQFYEPDLNLPRPTNIGQSANPTAASFSPVQGFAGEPCAFTIVGLYRQKNEWSEESYAFTPNTVFVPETSVPCKTQTGDSGIFHSLLLHNGTTAQMDAYLTESGLEGLLIYYDQGYGDIRDSLAGYYATSEKVLLLGLTAWVGMLLLYLLLFPLRQKKQLRRMWTLGATPAQMRTHLRYTNAGLLLPGGVLGAAVGALCMGAILRRVEQAGKLDAALSAPPWISLAALGLQLLLLCLLTEALARLQVRRVRTRYGRR